MLNINNDILIVFAFMILPILVVICFYTFTKLIKNKRSKTIYYKWVAGIAVVTIIISVYLSNKVSPIYPINKENALEWLLLSWISPALAIIQNKRNAEEGTLDPTITFQKKAYEQQRKGMIIFALSIIPMFLIILYMALTSIFK